jgi:hypothetical protein
MGFHEELVWAEQRVIGDEDSVCFLSLTDGTLLETIELQGYFGYLRTHEDKLFVLGCSEILCFAPPRTLLWHARELAVDGVTFHGVEGSILRVGCEMDPPGGWFAVELDLETGRELGRKPDFGEGYHGFYGTRE